MYGEGNQETPWRILCPNLSCMSRIFRPECSFGSREIKNPCIQAPDFSPLFPGARGNRNGFCRFVKSIIINRKSTDTIPCSMSPHSRTTSSRRLQDFPVCSALTPDSERPAILSSLDTIRVFVLPFDSMKKAALHGLLFFIVKTPDWSHTYAR